MASFADLGQISQQSEFQLRVRYALYHAAIDVFAEPGDTEKHTERVAYSAKVTSGQADIVSAAFAVLVNPSIASGAEAEMPGNAISDGDMQFAINSSFNALAGT